MLGLSFEKPEVTTVIRWLLRFVLVVFLAWLVRQRTEQEEEEECEENDSEVTDARARSNGLRSRGNTRPARLQPRRDPYNTTTRQRKGLSASNDLPEFDSVIEKVSKPKEMWQPRRSGEPLMLKKLSQDLALDDADGTAERTAASASRQVRDGRDQGTTLQGHERPVTFITFNSESNLLFSCGKDKIVCVWSFPDGELLGSYKGHNGAVWSCSATFDSRCWSLHKDPDEKETDGEEDAEMKSLAVIHRLQQLAQSPRALARKQALFLDAARFFGSSDPCMVKIPNVLVFLTGLLHSIASEAVVRLPEFKPGELSKTAWAYATCGFREGQFFRALAESSIHCIDGFTPQGLSNLIWAFATLIFTNLKLQRAVAQIAKEKMAEPTLTTPEIFNPQNLANTAWAFAKLFHRDNELFTRISQLAEEQMEDFSVQNLSNITWAFAKVRHDNFMFFELTSYHILRELARVELPGVVRCVEWAGAAPGVNASDVSERFVTCHNRFGAHPPALSVWRFDGKAIQELIVIPKLPSAANQVRWGRANYFIASAHDSGELIFWRADTGAEVKRLKAHDAGISKFDFNEDRELVATVSHDMSVCVWDIGKGVEWKLLYKAQTDRPLNAVALGPLSRSAAVGAIDERPKEVRVIAAGGQDVRDVARSSSATEQFGTLFFRLGTEKLPGQLKADGVANKGHFGPVHTLAFAGNGIAMASGSEDGFVRVHIFDKEAELKT
eukprot:symbB.v1.2.027496.t2/scaffold2828.1/size70857/1